MPRSPKYVALCLLFVLASVPPAPLVAKKKYVVPVAAPSDSQAVKSATIEVAGNGLLYVIRKKKHNGSLWGTAIRVDGAWRGVLSSGTFLVVEVDPGTHHVTGRTFEKSIWTTGGVDAPKKRSNDTRPNDLPVNWLRTFSGTDFFVKGFDRDVEVRDGEIVFLLFSEGSFYKNPRPVSIVSSEEGRALVQEYGASADLKDPRDDWVYPW